MDLGAAVDYARACRWSTWVSASRSGPPARRSSCGGATTGRSTTPCSIDGGASAARRQGDFAAPPLQRPSDAGLEGEEAAGQAEPLPGRSASSKTDERGVPIPSAGDDDAEDDTDIEGVVVAPDAYSRGEMLRHREFDRMTPAELRDAERLVDGSSRGSSSAGPGGTSCTRTAAASRRGRCSGATSGPAASS